MKRVISGFCFALLWFYFLGICLYLLIRVDVQGDTRVLLENAHGFFSCLTGGQFRNCEGTGQFPLALQIMPLIGIALHIPDHWILRSLAWVSFLSFIGCIWLFEREFRPNKLLRWVSRLTLLSSPFVWYSHTSFTEVYAALLTLGLLIGLSRERPSVPLCLSLLILTCLTKETVFVPLLPLLGALFFRIPRKSPGRRTILSVTGIGIPIAFALNSVFNFFRFGVFYNRNYMNNDLIVHAPLQIASHFLGIWFSPSGGITFFWPTFFILLVFALARGLLRGARTDRISTALLGTSCFILTMGFAKWYAPFGWIAWGPRLLLPWLPAILFLILKYQSEEVRTLVAAFSKHKAAGVAALSALAWFAAAELAPVLRPGVMAAIFAPTRACSEQTHLGTSTSHYYDCLNSVIWPEHWSLLHLFDWSGDGLNSALVLIWGALFFLGGYNLSAASGKLLLRSHSRLERNEEGRRENTGASSARL